jgi:hypothetical protein
VLGAIALRDAGGAGDAEPAAPKRPAVADPSSPSGRVTFRFFPASSQVFLDDRLLATGGANVVDRELPPGDHRLVLVGPDGRGRTVPFRVEAGETTNLATLSVGEDRD